MAWVRGLLVLLTISVNAGVVHTATEVPSVTTTSVTLTMTTNSSSMLPTSVSSIPFEWSTKPKPKTTPTTTLTQKYVKPKHSMSESVVILPPNSDRQAQDIYDKALKQFDSYGVSTRQLCSTWEKRGCQCSGTIEELTLSCRAIGLNETPTELPKNLIKL